MVIKPNDLKDQVLKNLKEYNRDVQWGMSEAARKRTIEGAKNLRGIKPKDDAQREVFSKEMALFRTGEYNKGWKTKKIARGHMVRNTTRPELTHLLEHGHATRNGTGWFDGIPHISTVEKDIVQKFEDDVERLIKESGGRK